MTRFGATKFGRAVILALSGLLLTLSVACTPTYQNHGYVPTDEDLAAIKIGVDTRDSIRSTIGEPSTLGLLSDIGWYYVQSRWKTVGGREPQEIDRQVVAITFNADGFVANIERFGLEQGKMVTLSRRVTGSNVRSQSISRQLLGNIGSISTDQLVNAP